jgi:hypothetical protein
MLGILALRTTSTALVNSPDRGCGYQRLESQLFRSNSIKHLGVSNLQLEMLPYLECYFRCSWFAFYAMSPQHPRPHVQDHSLFRISIPLKLPFSLFRQPSHCHGVPESDHHQHHPSEVPIKDLGPSTCCVEACKQSWGHGSYTTDECKRKGVECAQCCW